MFTPVSVDRGRAAEVLAPRRATELARPEGERVVEQPTLLEVIDQPRDRLIGLLAKPGQVAANVAVMVPAVPCDLHKPHARFAQLARQEARATVLVTDLAVADAVEVERILSFFQEIDQLRRCGLHAEGEFHVLDHPFHVTVALQLV